MKKSDNAALLAHIQLVLAYIVHSKWAFWVWTGLSMLNFVSAIRMVKKGQ